MSASAVDRLLQKVLLRVRPAIVASYLKQLLGVERRTVETKAGYFYIDPISIFGAALMDRGEYEPTMVQTLQYFLPPAGIFIDLGANEGYFSVVAAKLVGPSGRVIAVEPQERLKVILEKNTSLNQVQNVTLVSSAVSDQTGYASIFLSADTNAGATSLYQPTRYRLPTETVSTMTLSELFRSLDIDCADLVKVDIEGAEYEAILGSKELFEQHRVKALALELHHNAISKRGLHHTEIESFLKKCGYGVCSEFGSTVWIVQDA